MGQPKRFVPGRLETVAAAVACIAGVVLALARPAVPGDLALLIVAGVSAMGWALIVDEVWRHRPEKSADSASDDVARDTEESAGFGLHHRWLLGIVTPVVLAIVLGVAFGTEDLLGEGTARLSEVILLPVVLVVAPWIAGLVAWPLLVAPGRLILSGVAGNGSVRLFAGVWVYLMVAGAVTASLAVTASSFGRSGWVADRLGALLGTRDDLVTSPGLLLAARVLFGAALVALPVTAWIVSARAKRSTAAERA